MPATLAGLPRRAHSAWRAWLNLAGTPLTGGMVAEARTLFQSVTEAGDVEVARRAAELLARWQQRPVIAGATSDH